MKPVTFNLEIYGPGDTEDAAFNVDAETPFQSFQRGDLINPRYGGFSHVEKLKGKLMRVVSVEHGLDELDNGIRQYIRVYTELAEDKPETLLGS